jgi:hypothetical protein
MRRIACLQSVGGERVLRAKKRHSPYFGLTRKVTDRPMPAFGGSGDIHFLEKLRRSCGTEFGAGGSTYARFSSNSDIQVVGLEHLGLPFKRPSGQTS